MSQDRLQGAYPTYQVRGSWPAVTSTGATALVFDTFESGPIAFALPKGAIETLRKQLAEIEVLLSRGVGNA